MMMFIDHFSDWAAFKLKGYSFRYFVSFYDWRLLIMRKTKEILVNDLSKLYNIWLKWGEKYCQLPAVRMLVFLVEVLIKL